jgi:hypothetical protein
MYFVLLPFVDTGIVSSSSISSPYVSESASLLPLSFAVGAYPEIEHHCGYLCPHRARWVRKKTVKWVVRALENGVKMRYIG